MTIYYKYEDQEMETEFIASLSGNIDRDLSSFQGYHKQLFITIVGELSPKERLISGERIQ